MQWWLRKTRSAKPIVKHLPYGYQTNSQCKLLLSMVVHNSRDQPKIYGFQKGCTLINYSIKIRIQKTCLNTVTTALTTLYVSSFKQSKCCSICPLENFEKLKQDHIFVYQPACQPVSRNWPRAYTTNLLPSNFLKISFISVGTNLCYSNCNTRCSLSPILYSFTLTNWNKGFNIQSWN